MKEVLKMIAFKILHKNVNNASIYKKILNKSVKCDKTHRKYLHLQLSRTLSKKNVDTSKRYTYLINRLKETVDVSNFKVLCVGCRSVGEINYFKSCGAKKVIGIDLFSESKEILIMDMHDMNFEDNSFDLIFSCHSLEHARDYKKVVSEFVRVAKNGSIFVIEVPVNYETKGSDFWDFKSLENLKKIFQPYIEEILFEEFLLHGAKNNFSGTDIVRIIFKIKK